MNFENSRQLNPKTSRLPLVGSRSRTTIDRRTSSNDHRLSLRELEALPRSLLSVLLAFFGPRIARYHAFGLELGAQLSVKQHESSGDAKADCIGLSGNSAAAHVCQDVERGRSVGRDQCPFRGDALRGRHKVFIECFAVDFELAAAGTKKNTRDRRLAASGSVILNYFCHFLASSRELRASSTHVREE
jgi:hypothetical protein